MFVIPRQFHSVIAAAGLGAALWVSAVDSAAAANPFRPFLGNWRGSGVITSMDGRREPISCRATYESAGESAATITLVCASDAFRVNIDCSASVEDGVLRGQWRETTRGVQGDLSGQLGDGDFEGDVNAGGVNVRMSVRSNGRKQAVSIRPSAGDVRSVDVMLAKSK